MTPTPLPPLPKSSPEQDELFGHLYEYGVSAEGVHQRLEKVCQAYATQARADLEAENKRLREALEAILDEQNDNEGYAKPATYDAAYAALESKK